MGTILLLASLILITIFSPIVYIYGAIKSIFLKGFDEYQKNIAISLDQTSNALGSYLFNDIFITKESKHLFGNADSTISAVIGLNLRDDTLTLLGAVLAYILNRLDKGHTEKAIEND